MLVEPAPVDLASFVNVWPREFAAKSNKFVRNVVVEDAEQLYNLCEAFDFTDCFVSVCSFTEISDRWVRDSAVIDRLFFDFDSRNVKLAARDALKLVEFVESLGGKAYVVESGCKGFHVYLPVPPTNVSDLPGKKDAMKLACKRVSGDLSLLTYDSATSDVARVARIPYTVNSKTNRTATPLTKEDLWRIANGKLPFYDEPEPFSNLLRRCSREYVEWIEKLLRTEPSHPRRSLRHSPKRSPTATSDDSSTVSFDPDDPIQSTIVDAARGRNVQTWVVQRAVNYAAIMKKYGSLWKSKYVRRIHENEHYANVHFVNLLIKCGLSDEEIHWIFSHYEKYDPNTTQYYVEYNRNKLRGDDDAREV